jgi:hypothetical protein
VNPNRIRSKTPVTRREAENRFAICILPLGEGDVAGSDNSGKRGQASQVYRLLLAISTSKFVRLPNKNVRDFVPVCIIARFFNCAIHRKKILRMPEILPLVWVNRRANRLSKIWLYVDKESIRKLREGSGSGLWLAKGGLSA